MARGDTLEPALGVPSLTAGEITQIYQEAFGRPPTGSELSSELENANKYSAAGIERQIRNRAANAPGTGIRGDEGLPALTMPRPIRNNPVPPPSAVVSPLPPVGSVVTSGPSTPSGDTPPTVGPTGLANPLLPINYATMQYGPKFGYSGGNGGLALAQPVPSAPGSSGFDLTTYLIIGGMALAAWYLFVK